MKRRQQPGGPRGSDDPTDVVALRLQLLRSGFAPLPLFGKSPPVYGKNNNKKGLSNWQNLRNVSAEQIEIWTRTWPDAKNTGVLTSRVPTLDLDIRNEAAVRAIEDHVREHYEERGHVLVRVGNPPKAAIPFRTDEPFAKVIANVVAANGNEEKIEFLADGEQFVVNGIHPETGQSYRWHGGELWQINRGSALHPGARRERASRLDCRSSDQRV
jgi:Bifunctional DNA primase/polymerase, N-terminal